MRSPDSPIPSGEPLIGQTVKDVHDLARIAQILRDPLRETVRFVFVDDAGRILAQEAYSYGAAGVTASPWGGGPPKGMPDYKGAAEFVADRLAMHGATGFYQIHNHPSQNPQPSTQDIDSQKIVGEKLRLAGLGGAAKGHLILDGDRYGFMSGDGTTATVAPLPKDLIDKAEVLFDPNVELPEFQTAAELAAYVKSWTSGGDQAIVLATTGVNGLRAVFEIPMDQLFVMLQRPQRLQATLRRLRRESGASRLYFFVPAALLNVMRLDPRFTKLIHLAINSDTIYSLRDLETGNSFNWPDKPPEPYEGYVEGLHYTGLNLKSYRDHVSAGFLRYMQGEVDPRPYKGERIVFRVPQSVVDADDKLFPADSVTKQGGLLEQWGFTLLTQHRLRHNAKNSGANFVQIWEGPDEPWAHEFLKEHGFKIDKTATRNFNAWNSDRGRSASPLGRLFSRQPYRSRRHIEPYPVRTPAGETRSGSPDFQSEVERLRGLVQIGGVRENLFEEGEGLNERIVELSKIAKKWHEQFGGGQKSAYNHLRKAWEAGHEEAKSAVELAGLPNVAQAPKKTGSLFGSSLDAELNGQGELFSDHWLPGLNKNDEGLERNLATFLAMRNRIKGNLSQLSSRWPGVAKAARRVANSTAQVMVMIRNAVPQIEAEGVPWELLAAFLSEGRLRGIEQRWWDLARYVEGLDDGDLEAAYVSFLRGPAAAIRMDAPVEAAIANGDLAGAQDMLFNAFVDAAERVTHLMSDAMFQQAMMSEDIQRGWLKYKELLEGQLAEIHALNEGIFSTALGPLDTYYPLSAMRDEETLITRTRDRFRRFRKPKNPANYFATGLASAYDTSVGAFAQKLEAAVRANNTAKLIELLEQNRLLKKLTPKERSAMGLNPTFVIDGIEYTAVIEEIKPPRIIIRGAETIQLPGEVAVIPEWLWQELQPIIKQKSRMDMGGFLTKLLQAVNTIGMGGPLDAVFHTSNVIGALVSGTPYAGTGWLAKSIGNTPLTKIFTAIANIIHTDPNTPEALAELMEMAKNGELPNRYGTETISAEYARATGAEQKVLTIPMPLGGKLKLPYTFGPLLYGPSGLDIRARLLMHRIAKQFNPNATPQELFEFTSQMGVYVRGLESDMVRWLKDTGVGPFATAGTTMWWNGVDIWLMKGPAIGSGGRGRGGGGRGRGAGGPSRDPMRNMKFRIAQQLSAGAIGVVAAWIALYFVYRKKWPWEEREARLLEIPLKPEHRESKLAKALYGPDTGTTAYVSFGFFAPMVMRGSRSIGVKGAFNTMAGGGTAGQGAEAAFRDMVNSALHPITSGPAFQGAFTMATGAEPYIIGTRDLQGNYTWKLIQTVPKKEPGWPQFWENIKHGIIHINSFAEDMLVSQGALEVPEWQEGREPTTLRAIVDIMFPRLLGTEQKPMRRQLHYQREILESRTSREGRRTGTYQRMRRRLTPGSSR